MKIETNGEQVLILNDQIALTHFKSETRQLFETEEGSFVWYIDESKLYELPLEEYTKLLLKLNKLIEDEENLKYK